MAGSALGRFRGYQPVHGLSEYSAYRLHDQAVLMARLIGDKAMNQVVSHLEGVKGSVAEKALAVGEIAEANLLQHRKVTNRTNHEIDVSQGDVDSFVSLEGPAPLSVEFGHQPSGAFEGSDTRPPAGLYIITGAAGLI
ncbi:DUF5403 family protein [Nocardia sp. NPDC055002]